MRITFLTRKFPPSTGGMETFSYELTTAYSDSKRIIHYGQKQWHILWAAPLLLLHGLFVARTTDVYHIGDLVLGPVGALLRRLTGKPVVVTAHALELTHGSSLLRRLINWSLPSLDRIVAVSTFTVDLLRQRGVPADRIEQISHGVHAPAQTDAATSRNTICTSFTIDPERLLLVSVGRLVKRKGVEWFIRTVLPQIHDLQPQLLIASRGPEYEAIHSAIEETEQQDYAQLLGYVDAELLPHLYAGADIVVMPNIPVENDAEGFGFVAIEAAAHGAPLLASNLEGIPSAIHHEQNGLLLPAEDADAWEDAIRQWHADPSGRRAFATSARSYTVETFQWSQVAQQYQSVFESCL